MVGSTLLFEIPCYEAPANHPEGLVEEHLDCAAPDRMLLKDRQLGVKVVLRFVVSVHPLEDGDHALFDAGHRHHSLREVVHLVFDPGEALFAHAETPLMMVKLTMGVSEAVPTTDAIVIWNDVAAVMAVTKAT